MTTSDFMTFAACLSILLWINTVLTLSLLWCSYPLITYPAVSQDLFHGCSFAISDLIDGYLISFL